MIQRISLDELTAELVSTHGVVCIDMMEKLEPEEFVQLSKKLGKVLPFKLSKYRPESFPEEVTLLDNFGDGMTAATPSFGEGWHQDSSFLTEPPAYTVLHALDVPSNGGETLFANTQLAWKRISENKKQIYRQYKMLHAVRNTYRFMPEDVGKTLKQLLLDLPKAEHPLVYKHPRVNETLFLSPLYIEGNLDKDQHKHYVDLLDEVLRDQVSHQWKPGQILIWDNRVVLHAATGYSGGERRRLIRTVVKDVGY
ncbi:TauD/TfdA family dioxygenase [uncultured Shewanella sp.]|uniref:TauD/TfdA dioxygenase family protein n=1 Tax=uncultured Shewanella sp. TaxID=173975 RepID=UPI0026324B9F|nr:TauD/TfdA family dioxygenase [uncultured Shewanella sp.]